MLPTNLAFVDIETTGSSPQRDRIIEIAILRIENHQLVRTYTSLVNPNCHLPPQIESITGITSSELETAPSFWDIKDQLLEILDNCIFVAHNVRFDYSFIKHELHRYGINFKPRHFCTVKLSRALFPSHRHHDLTSLIERFNFDCPHRHRAFDDARILWEFYQLIHQQFPQEHLDTIINRLLKKPSQPLQVPPQLLDDLPESPGVYIFYGDRGAPLYVGKSVNIRQRVLSHFSADLSDSKEMKLSQQTQHIETIVTAGELGALLKESELVKQLQPLYNRQLRHARQPVVLKRFSTDQSYDSLRILTFDQLESPDLSDILGIFKSQKQAKSYLTNLAKEHQLCEKLLGLESTSSACFAYRLARCRGACVGKEPASLYNARCRLAFLKTQLQPWPFSQAIAIPERDPLHQQSVFHLVDQWCYLGSVTYDLDCQNISSTSSPRFDLDIYKILYRYLNSPKHLSHVKLIPRNSFSDSNYLIS